MKIYYLVYKLTNLVNGKIYIGCHMTKDMNDGYMGSGRRLANAKKKYGIENFKKEILSFHETPDKMLAEEKRLVTEEFLGRNDVYNLTVGGKGSWHWVNATYPKESRAKNGLRAVTSRSKEERSRISAKRNKTFIANGGQIFNGKSKTSFSGKQHTEETKQKMSLALQGKQNKEKNSQFGTMWITNGSESKKVKNTDIIPDGWRKGRK